MDFDYKYIGMFTLAFSVVGWNISHLDLNGTNRP